MLVLASIFIVLSNSPSVSRHSLKGRNCHIPDLTYLPTGALHSNETVRDMPINGIE
jgi:hypothetical protein